MSIIYDYLQLLEKKKKEGGAQKQETVQPNAPVPQKKSLTILLYFAMGLVILACASILLFWKNIKFSGPKGAEKVVNAQQNLNFAPQDFRAQSLNSENASVLEYSLKGIIYNAESPSAIINSQLVEKNGKIDDWQVMEISPSEVKLENTSNKSLLTLKLNSSSGQ